METKRMKVVSCPSESLSFTNRAVVNAREFDDRVRHVEITTAARRKYIFSIHPYDKIEMGSMGFNLPMRKWAELSLNEVIEVKPFNVDNRSYAAKIILEVDFLMKTSTTAEPYDTDEMAKEFTMNFGNQAFTVGQTIGFKFADKKLLKLVVKEMEALSVDLQGNKQATPKTIQFGIVIPNSSVAFEKAESSSVNLTGKARGKMQQQSIINPNWDFENMGIGGLDKEFNDIFRRAFASRVFPVELIEQLGLKHVRGILLFGPPGTGKTLMARQIGTMLNAREPKIVNGPQILDKYVGESEANIRRLFEDAENEFKRVGNNSGLHIIIFDEIDAICKARGSMAGSSGVHDTVVNQLLSKIDGVESLNNILVIGMTNRRDMIDEALLRPGRLEVQMEIGLPDEKGRAQILAIHTHLMRKYDKLANDVNLNELATLTKNFSGAEIEGLVRAAQSCAMNRLIKASSKVEVDPDAMQKMLVCRNDFMHALEHDVKPAFGSNSDAIEQLISGGIIYWGAPVTSVLEDGQIFINQARNSTGGMVSLLLEGPPNTGKTALAAQLALSSDFPFVKLCTPEDLVGYSETAKCMQIRKIFDDAYKSQLSCLIVDNIERLIDYVALGPRFSNLVLQALLVVLKKKPPKGRKLLVLCTTSRKEILEEMEMLSAFTAVLHVPNLTHPDHLNNVLKNLADNGPANCFTREERSKIAKAIDGKRIWVGIKKLLALIDMSREMEHDYRVPKFMAKLEDEGCVEMR